jgi:hypothetical protein
MTTAQTAPAPMAEFLRRYILVMARQDAAGNTADPGLGPPSPGPIPDTGGNAARPEGSRKGRRMADDAEHQAERGSGPR